MVKENGRGERNRLLYFAGIETANRRNSISLLPIPISYLKYPSQIVFCAITMQCQELINPAVFLNVDELYFSILIPNKIQVFTIASLNLSFRGPRIRRKTLVIYNY